jgi:hypothetical protein
MFTLMVIDSHECSQIYNLVLILNSDETNKLGCWQLCIFDSIEARTKVLENHPDKGVIRVPAWVEQY